MAMLEKSPSHNASQIRMRWSKKARTNCNKCKDAFLCPQRRVQPFVQRAAHPIFFYRRKSEKAAWWMPCKKSAVFARYISSYARCCWHSTKGKEREPFTQQWPSAFGMCERRGYSQSKIRCTKMFLKACVCASAFLFAQRVSWGRNLIWPYSPWDLHDALTVCAASTTHTTILFEILSLRSITFLRAPKKAIPFSCHMRRFAKFCSCVQKLIAFWT